MGRGKKITKEKGGGKRTKTGRKEKEAKDVGED